jgi:hypothetical protein
MRARWVLTTLGILAVACTSKKKPAGDRPPAAADERRSDDASPGVEGIGGDEQAAADAAPARQVSPLVRASRCAVKC